MDRVRALFIFFIGVLFVADAASAFAAIAMVNVDWSQLQVELVPLVGTPPVTLTYTEQGAQIAASAKTPRGGQQDFEEVLDNWSEQKTLAAHTPGADSAAAIGAALLKTSASITALPPACCDSTETSGRIARTANFTVAGAGSVIFSAPYSLSVDGIPFDSSNISTAEILATLNFSGEDGSFSNTSQSDGLTSLSSGPVTTSGTLRFGILASSSGTGSLYVSLSSSAIAVYRPIPEPSVCLALVGGLSGLLIFCRRRMA